MTGDTVRLHVSLSFAGDHIPVGTLATDRRGIFFEYLPSFIERQLHLSPFMLPLREGLHHLPDSPFNGLPGLFNDSLPDGWGRLLLHQELKGRGISPASLHPLDELAMVGSNGMGALAYHPEHPLGMPDELIDLDTYAAASRHILEGSTDDMLAELRAAAGTSAGARPKVLVTVDAAGSRITTAAPNLEGEEAWIIKFPGSSDSADAGAIEYVYSLMAKEAGITMSACRLFPARHGPGYFGTRRFDRNRGRRLHVHSLSGLVHDDHRHPCFDYRGLLAATHKLTLNPAEVEAMFRLAVFNVLAHNRDDHSKNFAFIMEPDGRWSTAPAFDLTFSSGPNGYQSMAVMDEARRPTLAHLRRLGTSAGIRASVIPFVVDQVSTALASWPRLARAHGVVPANAAHIQRVIDTNITARA